MPYGYNGKILHVDLSAATLTLEEPPEEFYRKYMGGTEICRYGCRYRYRKVPFTGISMDS